MIEINNEVKNALKYDAPKLVHRSTNAENSLTLLNEVLPVLEAQEAFDNDSLFEALKAFGEEHEYKTGFVMWPLRTAVSGKQATPGGATELMSNTMHQNWCIVQQFLSDILFVAQK